MIIRHGDAGGLKIDWARTLENLFFPRLYKTKGELEIVKLENDLLYKSDKITVVNSSELNFTDKVMNFDGTVVFKGNYINICNDSIFINQKFDIDAIYALGCDHLSVNFNSITQNHENQETLHEEQT